jgi:RNA polymerase sigma-70 factor (ECF subfamily)
VSTKKILAHERRIHELIVNHVDFVARLLRNLGTPPMDIDDAVQGTFITALRRFRDIRPGYEKAFLFKIALRAASHARRSVRRRRHVAIEEEEDFADSAFSPEQLTDQKRTREALDAILEDMPPELRSIFVLHEFEGMTMGEIATILELAPGTVASRLRRARAGFRSRVQRTFRRFVKANFG